MGKRFDSEIAKVAMASFCLFFAVLSTCLCVVLSDVSKFRARRDSKLRVHEVQKSIPSDDLIMCVALCKIEQSFLCQTASWGEGACQLSEVTKINLYSGTPGLEKNNDWITMCRVIFPVFLVQGDGGRYSLSFEAGKNACVEHGTSIASRQDLLDAGRKGLYLCECGFLSDGSSGFVAPANNECGWWQWSEGIQKGCNSAFSNMAVYCKA